MGGEGSRNGEERLTSCGVRVKGFLDFLLYIQELAPVEESVELLALGSDAFRAFGAAEGIVLGVDRSAPG